MAGLLTLPAGVLPAVLAVLAVPAHSVPFSLSALQQLRQQPQEKLVQSQDYLTKFGWMDSTQSRLGSLQTLSDKLAEFQEFAGLPVTGMLDYATVSKIQEPRCGNPDKLTRSKRRRRRKRHELQGSRWRKRELTYKILSWPNDREPRLVRKVMREAFQAWEDVTSLTFKELAANSPFKANIDIRFEYGDHADGNPFDGPGGTLAHAFFPIYGGDAHFDKSENFNVKQDGGDGLDLFIVATHEFGHSLGLSHSNTTGALMAPFYQPPTADRDIVKEDDMNGIQELYGKAPNMLTPEYGGRGEEDEETEKDSTLCTDSSIDAMFTMTIEGKKRTYAFKGEDYWRLTDKGVMKNYPQKIVDRWGGVPGNLDAAVVYTPRSSPKETLFFFRGNRVWRLSKVPNVDAGYPKLISEEFKGIPSNIDAAFTWKRNRKIYFFKGAQYWRFDYGAAMAGLHGLGDEYPRDIQVFKGIPNNLDAVTTWKDGKSYFFKGNNYYKISDALIEVSQGYPRSTGVYWFGCGTEQGSGQTPLASQRGGLTRR